MFAQAANVEKLLNMLRGLDPAKDNLADNEEIQVGTRHLIFYCECRYLTMLLHITGIIPIKHGSPTQDRQADRQV